MQFCDVNKIWQWNDLTCLRSETHPDYTLYPNKGTDSILAVTLTAFFDDVTIPSLLRSVVQISIGHFLQFFSHNQDDSCKKNKKVV